MTNPHQTNSVEEAVRSIWDTPLMRDEHPSLESRIQETMTRLTTLVSEAKREGRVEALKQVLNLSQELYAEEDGIGGTFIDTRQVEELAALTTEGV